MTGTPPRIHAALRLAGLSLWLAAVASAAVLPVSIALGDWFAYLAPVGVLIGIAVAGRILRQPHALAVAAVAMLGAEAISRSAVWEPLWMTRNVLAGLLAAAVVVALVDLSLVRPRSVGFGHGTLAWVGGLALLALVAASELGILGTAPFVNESLLINLQGWYYATLPISALLAGPIGLVASGIHDRLGDSQRGTSTSLLYQVYAGALVGALVGLPAFLLASRAVGQPLPVALGSSMLIASVTIAPVLGVRRILGMTAPRPASVACVVVVAAIPVALDVVASVPMLTLLTCAVLAWLIEALVLLKSRAPRCAGVIHVTGVAAFLGVGLAEGALYGQALDVYQMSPTAFGFIVGAAVGLGLAVAAHGSESSFSVLEKEGQPDGGFSG